MSSLSPCSIKDHRNLITLFPSLVFFYPFTALTTSPLFLSVFPVNGSFTFPSHNQAPLHRQTNRIILSSPFPSNTIDPSLPSLSVRCFFRRFLRSAPSETRGRYPSDHRPPFGARLAPFFTGLLLLGPAFNGSIVRPCPDCGEIGEPFDLGGVHVHHHRPWLAFLRVFRQRFLLVMGVGFL